MRLFFLFFFFSQCINYGCKSINQVKNHIFVCDVNENQYFKVDSIFVIAHPHENHLDMQIGTGMGRDTGFHIQLYACVRNMPIKEWLNNEELINLKGYYGSTHWTTNKRLVSFHAKNGTVENKFLFTKYNPRTKRISGYIEIEMCEGFEGEFTYLEVRNKKCRTPLREVVTGTPKKLRKIKVEFSKLYVKFIERK